MKNKKRVHSIKSYLVIYTISFVVSILLFAVAAIIMSLIAYNRDDKQLIMVEMIVLPCLFAIVGIVLIISIIRIYKGVYKGLYLTSKNIIEDVAEDKKVFKRYPKGMTKEFDALNESVELVETHLNNLVIYSKNIDYKTLNLEYANPELNIISYASFSEKIPEIIMLSQAYRNAFLHVSYGDKISTLLGLSEAEIVRNLHNIFNYSNILIADTYDHTGFYVYVPQVDSMNRLKEEIELFSKGTSMIKNTPNGKSLVIAKISAVVYPFSDMEDILSDLRYAARQGKAVNIYLPDRMNKKDNKQVMHGSLSLNNATQQIANIAAIKSYEESSTNIKANIKKQISAFAAFINADYAGVVVRDDKIDRYQNLIVVNHKEDDFIKEDDFMDASVLKVLSEVADRDGTYYFSTRSHLNRELGNILDKFFINSGHLYVFSDNNGPLGMVFFINRHRDSMLDSYIRECAFAISYQVGAIIKTANQENRIKEAEERSDLIMKLTNYMVYGVDKRTFEIAYASSTFIDQFGDVNKKVCYKAIYGLSKPCPNCPLVHNKKMRSEINGENFETSLALKGTKENVSRLLMKAVDAEELEHNRFDSDLLINSFYSLHEDLKNAFIANGKGYLLLLSIENYKELVEKYGNEGYCQYLRKFTDILNERLPRKYSFYVYNNNTIAMIIPNIGRTEIIDLAEKIYPFTKAPFIEIDDKEFSPMNLNYVAVKYPQQYSAEDDLLRHVDSVFNSYNHEDHIDQIYFESYDYFRSASRREFINEVIDKSFSEGSFKVKLQPMINSLSKQIMGAELLIRLNDDYRNMAISADEVIKVAAQENKIGMISDALTNYIGDMYTKYGSTIFKQHGFTRLSINTDYSYFSDPDFLDKICELFNKYRLPNNFLAFEITEKELSEHFDFFRNNNYKIKQIGVYLVADQYTGEHLSLDKIKALGISEIKIPRSIVKDIDVNKDNLNQVTELLIGAGKVGVKSSVVGVENKDQYFLIRDIAKDTIMQGFYFYAPLEQLELIEALKIN